MPTTEVTDYNDTKMSDQFHKLAVRCKTQLE
jgi:hypothetical protein